MEFLKRLAKEHKYFLNYCVIYINPQLPDDMSMYIWVKQINVQENYVAFW